MILYGTKQTVERFKFVMPHSEEALAMYNSQKGERIHEWGARLFYMSGKKCLQVVNFASKLTLFFFDLKVDDIPYLPNYFLNYLLYLYQSDEPMIAAIMRYLIETDGIVYGKITDRSIISTMNRNHLEFADEGYAFFEYIEDGILNTHAINYRMNWKWLLSIKRPDKKQPDYIYPAEEFRSLIMARYGERHPLPNKPILPINV